MLSELSSWSDNIYHASGEKGLISIENLYIDGQFASFGQLSDKFDLPQSYFFHYLQNRHYVGSKIQNFETLPAEHTFFDILKDPPDSRHVTSEFVCLFDDGVVASTAKIREAWKEELGIDLPEVMWDKSLSMIHSCSVNSRHQLIQFKVLHRLHYSKSRLHKFYTSVSPLCDRCKVAEGALSHAFWF